MRTTTGNQTKNKMSLERSYIQPLKSAKLKLNTRLKPLGQRHKRIVKK